MLSAGCALSRRRFMKSLSASALGMLLYRTVEDAPAAVNLGETIDLAGLRPKPLVNIMSATVRIKPPYWLGWPGTSYNLEGSRQKYDMAFSEAAKGMGVTLEDAPEPLESDEAINAFVKAVEDKKPHAVVVKLQHMGSWHWADRISRAGVPTIIFAPVGTAFTGHVLEISRRPGVRVVSSLEASGVAQAMRMVRAKRQFEESRLLVVAGQNRSETVLERLGTKIRYIPRRSLHEMFERMPVTDEMHEIASERRKSAESIVEPSEEDTVNAARSFVAAKRLLRDERANALTTDCLGMVTARVVPTPPCMAASMFQDAGVTYGCEADVFGAISLMFSSYLFDKPGFMNDPVPETVKNLLIAAHCSCGAKLNGLAGSEEPFILRSHSESDLGVSMQVLWKPGQRVTLVRFQGPNELILDTGTVTGNVDTPPAGGCRTNFEIQMDRVEDARDVLGFHQVVFYGDHRRDVEDFCQMYGIDVVNSPQNSPRG